LNKRYLAIYSYIAKNYLREKSDYIVGAALKAIIREVWGYGREAPELIIKRMCKEGYLIKYTDKSITYKMLIKLGENKPKLTKKEL